MYRPSQTPFSNGPSAEPFSKARKTFEASPEKTLLPEQPEPAAATPAVLPAPTGAAVGASTAAIPNNTKARINPHLGVLSIVMIVLGSGALVILFWSGHAGRMGETGLFGHLLGGIGMTMLGAAMLGFFVFWIISDFRKAKANLQGAKSSIRRFLDLALNIAVYGGLGFIALASLATIGSSNVVGRVGHLVFIAASVTGIVFFRRWRKAHPAQLKKLIGPIAMVMFLVLGCIFLPMGLGFLGDYAADKASGPQTGSFAFVYQSYKTPYGRSAWLDAPRYEVQLQNTETGAFLDTSLSVDEWNRYGQTLKTSASVAITYYAHSQVLVDVKGQPS